MNLYTLAENCDYSDMMDKMIQDRLVVGIQNAHCTQQLQLDVDLTLEKAKNEFTREKRWQSSNRFL